MAQFFYINSQGQQIGPVEQSSLQSAGINPSTMVWRDGMLRWAPAGSLPELAHIFGNYSAPGQTNMPPSPPQPQTGYGGNNQYNNQYNNHKSYVHYNNPNSRNYNQEVDRPNSYLWLGIVATLMCCLPLGVVSIIYASKVDSCWNSGDINGAIENSNKAKTWGFLSVALGFVLLFFYFILILTTS